MPRPTTPLITVDTIIRTDEDPRRVVLIERRNEPLGWALPGGFVDVGETLEMAAVREAREETGLDVQLECLLGCYSNPKRDPRSHTVGVVYVTRAAGRPVAADDARDVVVADASDRSRPLAFDHRLILDDYLRFIVTGAVAPLR
jgi:8-oxo-dGTP diphosphatase